MKNVEVANARKAEAANANAEKLKSKASKWKVAFAISRAVAPTTSSSSSTLHETGVVNGNERNSEYGQANEDNVETSNL